jgi:hypothetical protein
MTKVSNCERRVEIEQAATKGKEKENGRKMKEAKKKKKDKTREERRKAQAEGLLRRRSLDRSLLRRRLDLVVPEVRADGLTGVESRGKLAAEEDVAVRLAVGADSLLDLTGREEGTAMKWKSEVARSATRCKERRGGGV